MISWRNFGWRPASFLSRLAMGLQTVFRANVPSFTTGKIILPLRAQRGPAEPLENSGGIRPRRRGERVDSLPTFGFCPSSWLRSAAGRDGKALSLSLSHIMRKGSHEPTLSHGLAAGWGCVTHKTLMS